MRRHARGRSRRGQGFPFAICRIVAVLGTLGASAATAAEPPPLALASGFRIELVADGLGAPRMLALDSSGTLLVSIPSQGRIVALPAARRPERLRSPVTVAEGLWLPHGLAVRDGHLWVAETGRVLRFRYDVTTHSATEPVVIIPDLPAGAHHWTRSIAFGPDGRLYVAIGSSCDICREGDRRRAAIVSYDLGGSNERLIARGLRNPVGLAFDPTTGALWTTVNERDWRNGGAPPDFLALVREGANYGWPDCYARGDALAPLGRARSARGTARARFLYWNAVSARVSWEPLRRPPWLPGRACPRRLQDRADRPDRQPATASRGLRDALARGRPGMGPPGRRARRTRRRALRFGRSRRACAPHHRRAVIRRGRLRCGLWIPGPC